MAKSVPGSEVVHVPAAGLFELRIGGAVAVAEYVRGEGTLVCTHTFVPPELRGRGIAERLVRAALEYARAERLRVVPACSYVAAFVERHPELVTPSA
jgi:predicted GNAT family acetyltransferase